MFKMSITVTNLSSGGYTINGTVVMTWPSVSAMSVAENLTFTGGNLTSSITVIASGSISGSPTFNNMTVNGYAWDYANNVYK